MDRLLESSYLLEVSAVVIIPVEVGKLPTIPDMPGEHPNTRKVGVKLRSKHNNTFGWKTLEVKILSYVKRKLCFTSSSVGYYF